MKSGIYDEMREHLKDFFVVDCALRSKNCIYVMFQRDPEKEGEDYIFRTGFYYPKTERVWGYDHFDNFYDSQSCVLPNGPVVVVDYNGQVISQTGETDRGSGSDGEAPIPLIKQVMVKRVVEIAGSAYMAGNLRTVFRRERAGEWTCLSGNDLAVRDEQDRQGRKFGFKDIGGFADDDIYACGGEGDLCRYDGRRWHVLDCPTNHDLLSICCAGNGKVYVGGMKGVLLEGRGDEWQVVARLGDTWIIRMEWFKDRLYLATDQGLYELRDGRIVNSPGISALIPITVDEPLPKPLVNERVQKLLRAGGASEEAVDLAAMLPVASRDGILAPAALHTLSTDGELLLLGGVNKVAVFDGVTWYILYSPHGHNMGSSL